MVSSGEVSPYQNIHSSLAPLSEFNPFEPLADEFVFVLPGNGPPKEGGKEALLGLDTDDTGILLQTHSMSFDRHLQYEDRTGSFR